MLESRSEGGRVKSQNMRGQSVWSERAACGKEPGQEPAWGKDRTQGVIHNTRLPFFASYFKSIRA